MSSLERLIEQITDQLNQQLDWHWNPSIAERIPSSDDVLRDLATAVLELFDVREEVQPVDTETHPEGRVEGSAIDIHRLVLTTPWEVPHA